MPLQSGAFDAAVASSGNPLSGMTSIQDAYNNALKMRQGALDIQKQYGEQAVGNALQQATDEQGNVDIPKAQKIAAGMGPNAAFAMQGFLKTGSELRGQQILQGGAMYNNIARAAMSVATDPSDENLEAQRGAMLRQFPGQAQQINTEFDAAKAMTQPADRMAWARNHGIGALDASDRMHQTFGTTFRQTGPTGATTGGWQAPPWQGGGVAAPAGQPGAPQGLDPGQAAERTRWLQTSVDYPDPSNPNVTKHGTNETKLRDMGVPDQYIYTGGAPSSPGTQPAAPGTQPGSSPLGTGRLPSALQNPNKPQATPAPAATPSAAPPSAPSPAGTPISGPTPEQKATAGATEEQGKLSPPRFQAEADAGTQAQSQQATLGNMLADTAQFTTGPLAGIVGKVRNFAGNLGLNINTEAQSAKESFNKLAAGLANAQGAGSDQRMQVNINANPHEELSPAGVDLVTRQLQGNADYLQARAKLAQQHPNKADYPGFQQTVSGLDPRVFQLSRMTQPQRDAYWKALDSTARTQLGAAIKKARDMGVLGGG